LNVDDAVSKVQGIKDEYRALVERRTLNRSAATPNEAALVFQRGAQVSLREVFGGHKDKGAGLSPGDVGTVVDFYESGGK
jgi:hypothetical protein